MCAVFWNLIQYGEKVRPATPQMLQDAFQSRKGRYFFHVAREDTDSRRFEQVNLRFDPDLACLSGDLFSGPDNSWKFSWKSDALYVFDQKDPDRPWDVAAICHVFRAGDANHPTRLETALVTFGFRDVWDEKKHANTPAAKTCQLALIQSGKTLTAAYSLAKAIARSGGRLDYDGFFSSFRAIQLNLIADPGLNDDPLHAQVLENVLGDFGTARKLMTDIYNNDIYVNVARYNQLRQEDLGYHLTDPLFNQYLTLQDDPAPDPWTFTVLLSNDPGPEGLGKAVGMLNPKGIFYNRTVAVVYPRHIVASYGKAYARFDPENPTDDDVAALSFRLRHTIIHELSHLLNLPHPWQRRDLAMPGAGNEPDALSWTNYGSRYPYGPINALIHQQAPDGKIAYSAKVIDTIMRDQAAFTPQERMHLHHASFDDIAAGQNSFTDPVRQRVTMAPATTGATRLQITFDTPGDRGDGSTLAQIATSYRYDYAGKYENTEPLTGTVTLTMPAADATSDQHDLAFRFGSGNLFLTIRQEHQDQWPVNTDREVLVYPLPFLGLGVNMRRRNTRISSRAATDKASGTVTFRTQLPLILPSWVYKEISPTRNTTLQVTYLRPDQPAIHSNQLCFNYEAQNDPAPFGAATTAIQTLMQHKDLQRVSMAARYFDDPYGTLPVEMNAIRDLMSDPDLVGYLEQNLDRPDLQWLIQEVASVLSLTPERSDSILERLQIAQATRDALIQRNDQR